MKGWLTTVLGVLMLLTGASGANAQALIPGGLTALPAVQLGPNKVLNPGFETPAGSTPSSWGTGSGWSLDQLTRHSGTNSYRFGGGSTSITQAIQLKKGVYNLSGWIKTQNLGSGTSSGVRLTLDFRPNLNEWKPSASFSGTQDWTFVEIKSIVVPDDRTGYVKLEAYNGPSGTAWFDDIKLEEQLGAAVEVFMLYPNYRGMLFDDQSQALRFDVTIRPPGNDFPRYTVRGRLIEEGTGLVVATQTYLASANFAASLDGSAMLTGRAYKAEFSLIDGAGGAAVYTYPAYRVSKVPASARASMNVSFNEKNRVLVRNTPRFILGVYDSGLGYGNTDTYWENLLWSPTGNRRMEGLRINTYLNYWYGETDASSMRSLMDNLKRHGVMWLQTGNCFDRYPAGPEFSINNDNAFVQSVGSHPGSMGYYTIDECIAEMQPGAFTQYDRLRGLDPDSATFAALLGNNETILWRDSADILSTDPYPLYSTEPAAGYNHGLVAEWTQITRAAVQNSRPFFTVLHFFKFGSTARWPNLQEMRSHAYMAIVEGAQGLLWWSIGNGAGALDTVCSGWCAEKTGYMNNLKAVVGELADLESVLIADDASAALTGNSNGNVKTKVKVVNGKGYVFAYNATNANASATFTWNTAPGTVTVNAESRTLAASGSSFTDSFGPYRAHVYAIANGGSGGSGSGSGGTTPLSVSFSNPGNGATVSGSTTVTVTGAGGTGYSYEVKADGTSIYTGTNATFSWNTTTVANGAHTLQATATDSLNRTASASITVTVSNTTTALPAAGGLDVFITSPLSGITVGGSVTVNVWVEKQTGTANAFSVTVGGRTIYNQTISSAHAVLTWDTRQFANGAQTMVASVRDVAGKTGTTSVTVTAQNAGTSPPPPLPTLAASFTAPTAGATVSGTSTVGISASGTSGTPTTFTLAVDGTTVSTQSVSGTTASYAWNTSGSSNGSHTLTLTVRDGAGRTATATRTVTVSNVTAPPPPTTGTLPVFLTSPPNGATVSGTVVVNVWVENTTGTNTYTLLLDGQVKSTQTSSARHVWFSLPTTGNTNGSHAISATVRDGSGKTGNARITVTVRN
jgi:hypothetical protein